MSGSGAGEIPPQQKPRRAGFLAVHILLDDLAQIKAMTPTQLRRYSGQE